MPDADKERLATLPSIMPDFEEGLMAGTGASLCFPLPAFVPGLIADWNNFDMPQLIVRQIGVRLEAGEADCSFRYPEGVGSFSLGLPRFGERLPQVVASGLEP